MSNVFQIKRGDLLPAMSVDLVDGSGAPVDVSDNSTSVTVHMTAEDGTVVVSRAAVKDGTATNRVSLVWEAGDTDTVGSYSVDWTVEAGGKVQTFPANSFNVVEVVPSYADLSQFSEADVTRVRTLTNEVESSTLSFLDITGLMARRMYAGSPDVYAVAHDVWLEKAAGYAELVDMNESGSSRQLGSLYKQALEMADIMGRKSPLVAEDSAVLEAGGRRTSRTRAIVRP